MGKGVKILTGVWIDRFSTLAIQDDVSLAKNVIITAAGGVTIGSGTMIGYSAKLLTVNHVVPDNRDPMRFAGAELKPVSIGRDVWIGTGAVILPGITVGEGAIIGSNAVVTKDVEAFSVVGGVPARVLKMR